MITKTQVLETIQSLPDDATADDVIEKILFLKKIERSIKQAENQQTYSLDELKQLAKTWQKQE
ncbi:MAG: hypothetical protein ACK4GN_12485 [Runella sp.]